MGHLFRDDDGQFYDAGDSSAGAVGGILVPGCLVDELALAFLTDGVRVGDSLGEDAGDDAPRAVIVAAEHALAPHVPVHRHRLLGSRTPYRTPSPQVPHI